MDTNALILAIVVALVGAIAPTMVAYSSLQQSKLNAIKTEEIAKKTDENTALTMETKDKAIEIEENTTKIKTATDGSLTEVKEQLKAVTEQNKTFQETIKALSDAMATRTNNAKRETGDLIAVETKNGDAYTDLAKKVDKLIEIMAGFSKDGLPVVAPVGEPLPVVAVKASEVKE